ncbi:AMP-binding protein [Cellulomonas denverensis]|uniref:AMP-binding protein n=1 Tax=Cellulomonas denverensis TaxID=264297 RepID=A0A7X6KVF6_9CELL|nr:AMP-binding protein [Cellulomonas denverensis]NKY22997.1 AMP-binding protein [Cellulomonas denverensis]GIG23925.1 acyl-CoA synthetase [Cellulomonas denverensis]
MAKNNTAPLTVRSQSIGDIPRRSAVRNPSSTAIIDGDTRFTYAELDGVCDRVAAAAQSAGLAKGDVVMVMSRNCWQLAVLPWSIARAGAVLAPVNTFLTADEVSKLITLVDPRAFIVDRHCVEVATEALEMAGRSDVTRLVIEPSSKATELGWGDFGDWASFEGTPNRVDVDDSDPVRLMFTSGSESLPKAVMLSSRALMWQYASVVADGEYVADDVELHFMPMYHTGQMDAFLGPDLYVGATSVIVRNGTPTEIMRMLKAHQVTKMFATPTKWIEILASPDFNAESFASVRKGYYGASAMPVQVLRRLHEQLPHVRLWNYYGQTEMSPIATVLTPEEQIAFAGSAGRPALNVEMAILDEENKPLADGVVGEVCFRSPHTALGYYRDEAATRHLFRGGWLHSGDLGYRAPTGRLYFVDRMRDTINIGGEKVSTVEVENAITSHEDVHECAVFGVADPVYIEAVIAVVVPRPGAAVDPKALQTFARRILASFKVPRHIFVVEALPKNGTGKVLKRQLREQYGNVGL